MREDQRWEEARRLFEAGEMEKVKTLYRTLDRDIFTRSPYESAQIMGRLGIAHCQTGESLAGIEFFRQGVAVLDKVIKKNCDVKPTGGKSIEENKQNSEDEQSRTADCGTDLAINNAANIAALRSQLLYNIGITYRFLRRDDEAIHALFEATSSDGSNADALIQLGQLYFEQGYLGHTRGCFETLACLQPDNPSHWLTLGYMAASQGDYEDAIVSLSEAHRLDPVSYDTCFHLAESYRALGRFAESLPFYQQMLPIGLERPESMIGYAQSLLALGRLEEGWDAFEFRRINSQSTPAGNKSDWDRFPLPYWNGPAEPLEEGQSLLVFAEGPDALLYASCLNDLLADVRNCVLECEHALHGLFARSFPRLTLIDLRKRLGDESDEPVSEVVLEPASATTQSSESSEPSESPQPSESPEQLAEIGGHSVTAQIALGQLPRFYRRRVADFPKHASYLQPEPRSSARWRRRLEQLSGRPKIGFLHRGTGTGETPAQTTIPFGALAHLIDAMETADTVVDWVYLGDAASWSALSPVFQTQKNVYFLAEWESGDPDEKAALLAQLDLILTPPGQIAHLAGALGCSTWLILPKSCDWRWTLGTGFAQDVQDNRDTPHVLPFNHPALTLGDGDALRGRSRAVEEYALWHPGIRLFRQRHDESWKAVFSHIEESLHAFLEYLATATECSPAKATAFPDEYVVRYPDEYADESGEETPPIFSFEAYRRAEIRHSLRRVG